MHPIRRSRARLAATVAVVLGGVLGAVVVPASSATADPFPSCAGNGCLPDNFNHWWCYDGSVNVLLTSAIRRAMNNLDEQTNYTQINEPDFVCNATTDVRWQENSGLGDTRGDFWCLAPNSAGRCERARLRLNPTQLTDTTNRRKTACHELGHSVGLTHGDPRDPVNNDSYTDCMKSGEVDNDASWWVYDQHHIDHANNVR
jgi:hypothetical protein